MDAMPFSSLSDPVEIARAQAALELAWREIERLGLPYHGTPEGERARAAQIVAGLMSQSVSDDELVRRVVIRFVDKRG